MNKVVCRSHYCDLFVAQIVIHNSKLRPFVVHKAIPTTRAKLIQNSFAKKDGCNEQSITASSLLFIFLLV